MIIYITAFHYNLFFLLMSSVSCQSSLVFGDWDTFMAD